MPSTRTRGADEIRTAPDGKTVVIWPGGVLTDLGTALRDLGTSWPIPIPIPIAQRSSLQSTRTRGCPRRNGQVARRESGLLVKIVTRMLPP